MEIVAHSLFPSVRILVPRRHYDERGFVSEVWRDDVLRSAGIFARFVQINHAFSGAAGTIRGLHFQTGNGAQAKLVRCSRGAIFDVVVDVRHGSPTFGKHASHVLSAENWKQVYVPIGFAHGYCTLQVDTEVEYQLTSYYDAGAERGIAWNDPALGIIWPPASNIVMLSQRDLAHPKLAELPAYFPFAEYPN